MNENIEIKDNLEINKALKEFELENAEQIQKNPEVLGISEVPKMVQLVMKWFGVQKQKQAEYILLGFVVIMIAVSMFLVFYSKNPKRPPTGYEGNIPDLPQYDYLRIP